MGGTSYSYNSRSTRAAASGYYTKSADQIFTQSAERKIHESMEPKKALLRESRDSEAHPNSVPIIFALDVTGSMGRIPHYLVKDGLPNLMAGIIQRGVPDPQILFLAIGDFNYDRHPLQVGQFESGDEELDLWLTRTYLEGGGGGNEGESYGLAWYYGAMHTATDAWDKRKQKGFIFTVGDEPNLRTIPSKVIDEIMGESQKVTYSDSEILAKAQERYHVYHLHITETASGSRSMGYWRELLGDHCIEIKNHQDLSKIVAEIVLKDTPTTEVYQVGSKPSVVIPEDTHHTSVEQEILL